MLNRIFLSQANIGGTTGTVSSGVASKKTIIEIAHDANIEKEIEVPQTGIVKLFVGKKALDSNNNTPPEETQIDLLVGKAGEPEDHFKGVSRQHLLITINFNTNTLQFEDLGSTNGTTVSDLTEAPAVIKTQLKKGTSFRKQEYQLRGNTNQTLNARLSSKYSLRYSAKDNKIILLSAKSQQPLCSITLRRPTPIDPLATMASPFDPNATVAPVSWAPQDDAPTLGPDLHKPIT